MRRTRALLLLLFGIAAATLNIDSTLAVDLPPAFHYTLHEKFIRFTQEPKSETVLTGTSVTLSCSTNIVNGSNYRLPELHWRFNGQLLNSSLHSRITTLPDSSHSELTIRSVSQNDSGYYECAVFDGYQLLDNGEVDYFAVILSKRAILQVLDVDLTLSDEELQVNYTLGESLVLPCETGVPHQPDHATWIKDGHPIEPTENVSILSDGTLLVLETSVTTKGTYQCTGYYSDEPLNSTTYHVSMKQASEDGTSAVIIDGPAAGVVAAGEQLTLTCYALNSEGLQIQWLKDGQVLNVSKEPCCSKIVFSVPVSSVQDSGTYSCQVMSGSRLVARSELNVTVASKPVVRIVCLDQPCQEDFIKVFSILPIKLSCQTSTPAATVHWYRNGVHIQDGAAGAELVYRGTGPGTMAGVYQCFTMTPAGMDYATLRVIRAGFSNPPGNFTCQAADQDSDITKPSVVLNWERPTFQAYFLSSEGYILPPTFGHYNIVYEASGISETVTVGLNAAVNDSAVIDLPVDGEYTFYLFFENDRYNDYEINRVAISSCTVDTIPRRLVPRRLSVTCPDTVPDSGSAEIPVVWNSPQLSPDVTLFIVQLQYVCLYNGTLNDGLIFPFRASFFDYVDNEVFSSAVGPLDPGTVCLLGGFYFFLNPLNAIAPVVPHETCGIPASPSTGISQLKLNCYESMAAVEVVTTGDGDVLNSTQLQGRCITPGRVDGGAGINEFFLEPGNTSISNLPEGTICSFYGSYMLQSSDVEFTFEPAQCIVVEDAPTPPTTTSEPSPQTTTQGGPETSQAGSGSSLSRAAIIWISVNISLAAIVAVAIAIACFVWRDYSRKVIKEHRKQLHYWEDMQGEVDLDQDPHVLPQFSNTLYQADALSVTTEVDYLYKEEGRAVVSDNSLSSLMKAMESDDKVLDSPKLIMDRFLNGCHERIWECSHESLPRPHEPDENRLSEPSQVTAVSAPSQSCQRSDSRECLAQHYSIPLKSGGLDNTGELVAERYIPSSGSSGYGTCSDHYFESNSSACTAATNDYFKSRLADVAECHSLSTCGEEGEGHQTMVDVTVHAREPSHDSLSDCTSNSDLEVTTYAHRRQVMLEQQGRESHRGTKGNTGYDRLGVSCGDNELVSGRNCLTPSSLPPEHYFTDDEGYLRLVNDSAV